MISTKRKNREEEREWMGAGERDSFQGGGGLFLANTYCISIQCKTNSAKYFVKKTPIFNIKYLKCIYVKIPLSSSTKM